MKRVLDLVLSMAALIVLTPVLALIALAVRLDSSGPALYTQPRVGRGSRSFTMHKFRTMVQDAEERLDSVLPLNLHAARDGDDRLYKIVEDPRVTTVGKFLRRHSLDELPQLYDVARGRMSLVGPRPLTPSEDRYVVGPDRLRSIVRPGLTGPWQVGGRNDLTFAQMMRLDCDYVARRTLVGDLLLLARTVPAVVRPQRAC